MNPTTNQTRASSASYADVILPLRSTLMGAARALTRSEADASDLVQDTLERTLRTFGRFVPGTDARAWSVTILTRLFIDRHRRRTRQRRLMTAVQLDVACTSASLSGTPDESAPSWQGMTTEDLKRVAATLSPRLRQVFELCAFGGLSHAQICAATGLPIRTVGTRMLRARRRMHALLLDYMAGAEARADRAPAAPAALAAPVASLPRVVKPAAVLATRPMSWRRAPRAAALASQELCAA